MHHAVSLSCFRHRASPNAELYKGLFYPHHLPGLLRAYMNLFPGWKIIIHHDDSVHRGRHAATCHALEDLGNVELVWCRSGSLCGNMLWRLRPIWDPDVDAFICRDLESLPTPREAEMVRQWIESGHGTHVIHDSTSHGGHGSSGPLMGGTIGFRAPVVRRLVGDWRPDMTQGWEMNRQGADQDLMNANLWHQIKPGGVLFHKRPECWSHPFEEGTERRAVATNTPGSVRPGFNPTLEQEWDIDREQNTHEANNLAGHVGLVFDCPRAVKFWDRFGSRDNRDTYRRVAVMLGGEEEFACETERMPQPAMAGAPTVDEMKAVDQWMRDCWGRIQLKETDGDRVILTSDHSTNYCFFLPIAAAMWREVCGRRPSVILVAQNTYEEWMQGHQGVVYRALRALGAEVSFVNTPEGYGSSTVAQVSRLLAGALPLGNARVITTDADMLPMQRAYFERPCPDGHLNIYCANAYDGRTYAICFAEARTGTWREIMPFMGRSEARWWEDDITRHMTASVLEMFNRGLSRGDTGNAWSFDERFMSARINEWEVQGGKSVARFNREGREPPGDRLDRCHWPGRGAWPEIRKMDRSQLERFVDCHLQRPGHTDDFWPSLRHIIAQYLPVEIMDSMDRYRHRFIHHL